MLRSPHGLRNLSFMPLSAASRSHDISNSEFRWQSLEYLDVAPSSVVRRWLQDEGSLTKQLIILSGNQFRVNLISESWETLTSAVLLRQFGPLQPAHKFWSRKVVLLGKGEEWVAAHTLIPEYSLLGPLQQVMSLKSKPLGEYLFSHPDLIRCELDFTPLPGQGWGRRSLFYLYGKPIMVAEFFLPAMLAVLQSNSTSTS